MLILAATPIGNIGDASPRLKETLAAADVIVAEDTRVTKKLLSLLGVECHASFVVANEHSESSVIDEVLAAAQTSEVCLGFLTRALPWFRLPDKRRSRSPSFLGPAQESAP
jgi:16S rRNA (cytidine1402-2'-O)-methyltransferase